MKYIRNFSIIAHINHGKSTLADRIIELCNNFSIKKNESQILDNMQIEKERGITIKAQTVSLNYFYKLNNNNIKFKFNLIDTPGHIDFNYEVIKSLSACEGAILLIDITKGIQSQTIFNYNIALKLNLKIIIVLNKIDIPNINIDKIKKKIKKKFNINKIILCSAKTGEGIKKLLKNIILNIPYPQGDIKKYFKALIIDSWFDKYNGVILLIKIFNGQIKLKDKIYIASNKCHYFIESISIFTPKIKKKKILKTGEVGFISAGIKIINSIKSGDTITSINNKNEKIFLNFKKKKPKVFVCFFPFDSLKFNLLNKSLIKLNLNDSSFNYFKEHSNILGLGFRCGFLGLLHMDIIKERLKKEFNIKLIVTNPTVLYKIIKKNNNIIYISDPNNMPNIFDIKKIKEPIAIVKIKTPIKYMGKIIKLCNNKRGKQINFIYYKKNVKILFNIPMAEIILNFFNLIKSLSNGFANIKYKFKKYSTSNIVNIDVFLNKKKLDFFSFFTHISNIKNESNFLLSKLLKIIPRQMFCLNIQTVINNKVILTKKIKSFRKNVLHKCYGGDITRKKKLLKKQKRGKKKMKKIGSINIPYKKFFIYK